MKYVITFKKIQGDVCFEFNPDGFLVSFNVNANISEDQLYWLLCRMPIKEALIKDRLDNVENTKLSLVPDDLSFEAFWTAYMYKVGNKKRTEKLWNELDDGEKTKVFNHLPRYTYYLKTHTGISKAYPETFLSQRRFENELPKN